MMLKFIPHSFVQCSSGCGSGYTTRNVTCTNGRIESPNECTEPRPIKYKQCENKSHCRWRYGKWKNCTCAGHQKRRITCWDGYKNKAASNCPDEDRPISRQRCNAPPNCKWNFKILWKIKYFTIKRKLSIWEIKIYLSTSQHSRKVVRL